MVCVNLGRAYQRTKMQPLTNLGQISGYSYQFIFCFVLGSQKPR